MVISHKYEFIFVKTYKTAGTSIEAFLSQYGGAEDVFTPLYPPIPSHQARNYRGFWNIRPDLYDALYEGKGGPRKSLGVIKRLFQQAKFRPHMPGPLIRRRVSSEVWSRYFKFCVERNPWDKTLSHFYMLKGRSNQDFTLSKYFDQGDFCLNYPSYTQNGEVIVDRVVKYERLKEELGEVFGYLRVPYERQLGVRAKSKHREKASYREVLSEKQARVIQNVFHREIALHGYRY